MEVSHAADWDESAQEGVCDIRVWVGEEAEIEFRWDKYSILATRGGEAFDANSSCNRPLNTAVRDQPAGTGAYHFRLTWSYAAQSQATDGGYAARKQGNGHCNNGGQEMNFTRAEVSLRPGGAAQISLYGETMLQVMGRWRRVEDRIELDINSARGMRGAKATGQIIGKLDGDRLIDYSSISFSGTTPDGKSLDVTFNAQ